MTDESQGGSAIDAGPEVDTILDLDRAELGRARSDERERHVVELLLLELEAGILAAARCADHRVSGLDLLGIACLLADALRSS